MKALSIWQPYASLIAVGAKKIETRHWAPPRGVCGQRIAIHASKTTRDLEVLIDGSPRFRDALGLHDRNEFDHRTALPLGAIVATAVLAGGQEFSADHLTRYSQDEHIFGWIAPGRFGWFLTSVVPLEEPIPYRGRQGVFDLDHETSARLIALTGGDAS